MATYKSKYYDPSKAHDYYMKHRQLKGRSKKASIADLSDEGKIAAKEVKARIQEELKAALKKVKKGDKATRAKIREQYREKYLKELESIRQDSKMVKPPKAKKTRLKGAKSGNNKASGGNTTKKQKAQNTKQEPQKQEPQKQEVKKAQQPTLADIEKAISKKVNAKIAEITQRLPDMSEQERADLKAQLTGLIKRLMAYK